MTSSLFPRGRYYRALAQMWIRKRRGYQGLRFLLGDVMMLWCLRCHFPLPLPSLCFKHVIFYLFPAFVHTLALYAVSQLLSLFSSSYMNSYDCSMTPYVWHTWHSRVCNWYWSFVRHTSSCELYAKGNWQGLLVFCDFFLLMYTLCVLYEYT